MDSRRVKCAGRRFGGGDLGFEWNWFTEVENWLLGMRWFARVQSLPVISVVLIAWFLV